MILYHRYGAGNFYQLKKRNRKEILSRGRRPDLSGNERNHFGESASGAGEGKPEVEMEDRLSAASCRSLLRMLELSR